MPNWEGREGGCRGEAQVQKIGADRVSHVRKWSEEGPLMTQSGRREEESPWFRSRAGISDNYRRG